MEQTDLSSSSSVLVTGNAAVFIRVLALDASRAVISGARPGGQDRPHVSGPPPAERHRPVQRGQELLITMGSAQRVQLSQVASQASAARGGSAGEKRLGDRPESAERLFSSRLRP